jgi:ABC-type branched-subunit amino acid transport system ATPase component
VSAVLSVDDLAGGYRALTVFHGASLAVRAGEVAGILGPNGAGKTTLLKTLAGLLPAQGGRVRLGGDDVTALKAHSRARAGLALVPEGRQIFAELSVRENLALSRAAGRLDQAAYADRVKDVLAIFPRLQACLDRRGGSLSGGEQQMLAIGRGLLLDPKVLMLDEPTQGLAPIMIRQVLAALQALKGRFALVVVEQNRKFVEELADFVIEMKNGELGAFPGEV